MLLARKRRPGVAPAGRLGRGSIAGAGWDAGAVAAPPPVGALAAGTAAAARIAPGPAPWPKPPTALLPSGCREAVPTEAEVAAPAGTAAATALGPAADGADPLAACPKLTGRSRALATNVLGKSCSGGRAAAWKTPPPKRSSRSLNRESSDCMTAGERALRSVKPRS